jgi:hypothetical protein
MRSGCGAGPRPAAASQAACILLCTALSAAPPVRFAEHTVATGLTGGYQVVAVDMNHDGKIDLVALSSGMSELVWFENPGWQRHVIAQNLSGMINLSAWDVDGDGIPEIVLASGFSMNAKSSAGIVSVLRHNGDPRQPWSIREIDRLPTSHRLRWADIDGSGKKVLINQPLTAATVDHPEDRAHTPLVFYRPGEWKRQTISEQDEGVVHGIYIVDWDGDGRDDILTAGFTGIHLIQTRQGRALEPHGNRQRRSRAVAQIRVERRGYRPPGQAAFSGKPSSRGTVIRWPSTRKAPERGSATSSTIRSPTATPFSPPI